MRLPKKALRFAYALLGITFAGCCHRGPATPGFWGPADFKGSWLSAVPLPPINAQTKYNGDIVFADLPRSVVQEVLPADLKLADNTTNTTNGTSGNHPVILIFGVQTHLSSIWPLITGVLPDYNELILLIPFVVQKTGGQNYWQNYAVRMYLDWDGGVYGGNFLYGYRKEKAVLVRTVPSPTPPDINEQVSQVDRVSGAVTSRFVADVTSQSVWMDDATAENSLANYDAMKLIFTMPILGTLVAPNDPSTTAYICSYFLWDFTSANVRRETTTFQFVTNFVPNMDHWVALGQLTNTKDGGFGAYQFTWQLTYPTPCVF